jgi:hypothetical protein
MFKSKSIFVAVIILALIPLTASATITRVIGMGGEEAVYVMKDSYGANVYPQLIVNYPNLAVAEFWSSAGGWDFQKAYIDYGFGEDKCVLQFALDKLPGKTYAFGPELLDDVEGNYSRLSIIYGRPMGEMKIGLSFKYDSKSYKSEAVAGPPAVPALDASYSVIGLRAGVTAMENKLDVAAGFEMASYSADSPGVDAYESDGASAFSFVGRYWYDYSETNWLIPNLRFSSKKDGYTEGSDAESMTSTVFALGLGHNWYPIKNTLVLTDVGFKSHGMTYERTLGGTTSPDATDSHSDIYWRIGCESKVFNWLTGRFGAARFWDSAKYESQLGKPEISSSMTYTYLGATMNWNKMYIDVLVNPSFLGYGPNFLSGYDDDIFTRVSLRYVFDKE